GIVALNSDWAPVAAASLLTLGLLVLEVKGAASLFERQALSGGSERARVETSVSAAAGTWLAGSYRLVATIVVVMLICLLFHARRRDVVLGILLIAAYAFSVGAMFISLGAAIARPYAKNVSTTTSLVVAWAVINGGLLLVAGAIGGESSPAGL